MERSRHSSFAGDASQRVHAIVSSAEAEAAGLVRDAEREADLIRRGARAEGDQVLEDARRRADEIVAQRMRRIADLSDEIVERTEAVLQQIESVGHVRRQLDGLLRGLGEAAEAVSRESERRAAPRDTGQQPPGPPPAPMREVPPPRQESARPQPAPPASPSPRPAPVEDGPTAAPAQPPPQQAAPPASAPPKAAPAPAGRADEPSDSRFDGARLVALQMAVAGSTREEVQAELQRAFRIADPSPILDDVFGGPRRTSALN